MDGYSGEKASINSFALVSYLPEPLAAFLNRLRSDFVPERQAKAHVTVPRPITGLPEQAWQEIKGGIEDLEPFCVELGEIEIFPETQVIYLDVVSGYTQLDRLHHGLNRGLVKFDEPFPYHPHVTVAKETGAEFLSAAVETAARRWREFPHSRRFTVDRLTFVQNTSDNRWMDLHACRLAARVAT